MKWREGTTYGPPIQAIVKKERKKEEEKKKKKKKTNPKL